MESTFLIKTMRERIWNNLLNIKFKAFYIDLLISKFQKWDRNINIFLALTSTGSIAAWAVWQILPELWGIIIAASQVMNVIKPYFPFSKVTKFLQEMYLRILSLHLDYEKLWYDYDHEKINDDTAAKIFFDLQAKEPEILKSFDGGISFEDHKIEQRSYEFMSVYIQNNFNIEYSPA